MQLTRYEAAQDWLACAQTSLEIEEAKNSLIVGIAARLAEHPDRIKSQPYLATVEEDNALVAAAVMTPPHRVILYNSRGSDSTPLRPIIADLVTGGWSVPGVIARSDAARAFAEVWTTMTGRAHRPGMNQRLYELRRVIPPAGVPGQLRAGAEDDLVLAGQWFHHFTVDAHLPGTAEEARSMAEVRLADRDLFFWEVDGCPVSMAAKTRHSSHGITVSFVYTPDELRRRGYASACVAALSQRLLDAGWDFCTLYTDLANPTSNAIYQQIGYVPICDSNEYDFETSGKDSG